MHQVWVSSAQFDPLPLIVEALDAPQTPAVAFNDHTSAALLHPSVALHDRPFDLVPEYPVTDMSTPAFAQKMEARAKGKAS